MKDTYDNTEVLEDEKTIEEEAAEEVAEDQVDDAVEEELEEEVEEVAEAHDAEENTETAEYDLAKLYDKIDELASAISERFDSLSSVLIDAGAVVKTDIDEMYDAADEVEDRLEDLDYTL